MDLIPKRPNSSALESAIQLKNKGASNEQIIQSLEQQNYSSDEISSAIDQASVKNEIDSNNNKELQEVPSPPPEQSYSGGRTITNQNYYPSQETMPQNEVFGPNLSAPGSSFENIEEIAEAIVKEKWDELTKDMGDLKLWKEKIDTDLSGVKQELIRTQNRFESLQKAMLGKINDYDSTMKDVSSEMKALSQVFEKIIGPLTKNVKELAQITEKLSKKR